MGKAGWYFHHLPGENAFALLVFIPQLLARSLYENELAVNRQVVDRVSVLAAPPHVERMGTEAGTFIY